LLYEDLLARNSRTAKARNTRPSPKKRIAGKYGGGVLPETSEAIAARKDITTPRSNGITLLLYWIILIPLFPQELFQFSFIPCIISH
jgi:hypothetical protein